MMVQVSLAPPAPKRFDSKGRAAPEMSQCCSLPFIAFAGIVVVALNQPLAAKKYYKYKFSISGNVVNHTGTQHSL